jgi:Uma2 family endonuclease
MSAFPTNPLYSLEPAWEIALLFPPQGKWSVAEYLSLTDDTPRLVEYTGGKIEVLAMPTTAHQRILAYLYDLLKEFIKPRGLGEALFAALRVQLAEDKFREPDIIFVHRDNKSYIHNRYWTGADLVMEIVSEDQKSRERDLVTKRQDYAEAGVKEYWIVDPQTEQIIVLALDGDEYVSVGDFRPGEQASSKLLDGFAVDVAEVFRSATGPF